MTAVAAPRPGVRHVREGALVGLAAGALVGLVAGAADGWLSWSLFLGAVVGCSAGLVASGSGVLLVRVTGAAGSVARVAAVALAEGAGAAVVVAVLTRLLHVVEPWSVVAPLASLLTAAAFAWWRGPLGSDRTGPGR
ncbi:hypothetical protein GC089_00500 [Cellulomonas sp. JZ18]|uniref:hypothetical protein n=1 Tax=Cellulomonas sp. JZ18 TaxID=2654191 RepID=UPI0012D3A36C|nr:hypothetical protein [Cellulomonas sp. JZ18]QGQ18024.1 hypothetical protein GC089_00500 [Cellulomonas sp. JZ18]